MHDGNGGMAMRVHESQRARAPQYFRDGRRTEVHWLLDDSKIIGQSLLDGIDGCTEPQGALLLDHGIEDGEALLLPAARGEAAVLRRLVQLRRHLWVPLAEDFHLLLGGLGECAVGIEDAEPIIESRVVLRQLLRAARRACARARPLHEGARGGPHKNKIESGADSRARCATCAEPRACCWRGCHSTSVAATVMSAPPAIAAKAAPQKLRINCSSCGTLCEVQIPAMDPNRKKPIRFQIKCPKCHTLNEMRAAPPAPDEPPAGAAAATGAPPPGAPASAGQKRKADEPPLPPLAGSKKAAKEDASSSGASNGAKAAKSKAGEHPAPPAKPRPPEPKPKASKPAAAPRAPAPKAAATTSPRPGGRGGGRGGRSAGGRAGARGGAPFGGGGRGGSGAGPSSSGGGRGGVTADELDEFVIEEASERLPSKSEGKARVKSVPTGKLLTVGAKPHVHAISAYERAFPSLSVGAPASCELAYAQALARPRWRENDEVEVAFKGKGFEGSWAAAVVVKPDGKKHVLVRYLEFVDNDGTPLVEQGASLTRSPSPALSLSPSLPLLGVPCPSLLPPPPPSRVLTHAVSGASPQCRLSDCACRRRRRPQNGCRHSASRWKGYGMTAGGRAMRASSTCTRASSSSMTAGSTFATCLHHHTSCRCPHTHAPQGERRHTPSQSQTPACICTGHLYRSASSHCPLACSPPSRPRPSRPLPARSANWLWLPLRCTRPRPAYWLYYPMTRNDGEDSEEEEEDTSGRLQPGICGQAGCILPNGHAGLCQVQIKSSRRDAVKEKAMVQQQVQRLAEIQASREIQAQVAIAVRAAFGSIVAAIARVEPKRTATSASAVHHPHACGQRPRLLAYWLIAPCGLLACAACGHSQKGGGHWCDHQGAARQPLAVARQLQARRVCIEHAGHARRPGG